MKRMLAPLAVALSVSAAAIAGPSLAAEGDRDVADGAKRLQIEFSGRISQRCSMGDIPDANLGVMGNTGFRIRANMALDCNVPFTLSFQSSNGGIAHDEMPNGQGPYAGRLTYQMRVDLPVRSPEARVIEANFTSDQMRSGATVSSQDGISNGAARLRFDVAPPTGAGLLAGRYSETITVVLAPRT